MCLILRHFENLNKGLKQSYSNQQLSGVQLKESKEAMVTGHAIGAMGLSMLYNFFLLDAKKTTTNENFIYRGSSSSKYKCPNIGCKCPYNGRPKLLLFFP